MSTITEEMGLVSGGVASLIDLSKGNWRLGEGVSPDSWIQAHVPGNIQDDLWRAGLKPDPYVGDNANEYRDTESKFWTYSLLFDVSLNDCLADWDLVFDGVDYKAEFFLNSHRLGMHEGMFGEIIFHVSNYLSEGQNELRVIIHPLELAPHDSRALTDDSSLLRNDGRWMVKSLMSFLWDFAPRLVPTGIWKEVKLVPNLGVRISAPRIDCDLSDDYTRADLRFTACIESASNIPLTLDLELYEDGQSNTPVMALCKDLHLPVGISEVTLTGTLANPKLWWPNGMGEPYLYTAYMTVRSNGSVIDTIQFSVGIRSFEIVRTPKDANEQQPLPSGALNNETMFVVNGKPVYYRGANFVPADILFGRIDDERIENQMRLVQDCNINLLRVWGGGIVNRDKFYELADSYGIMIWQEFPLGCADHSGNKHYQDVLYDEASSIVRRLRKHPSIVMWCGGNELFQPHSGMGPLDSLLRMLNAICYNLDPQRVFLPSSPYPGAYHGPYTFDCCGQDDSTEPVDWVQFCNNAPDGAYNEFGVAGTNHSSAIREFIPKDELWPPACGGNWEFHKAFGAWGDGECWLNPQMIESYFGSLDDLDDLCRAGQFLQAIGIQYLCEEMRRRWPDVPGTMPWCFNYPWTTAAGNCIVAYPDVPLPAYYTLQKAYQLKSVSARLEHFVLLPGETTSVQVFLCNDSPEPVDAGKVTISIGSVDCDSRWHEIVSDVPGIAALGRYSAEPISFTVPEDFSGVVQVYLSWQHDSVSVENEYWMGIGSESVVAYRNPSHGFQRMLDLWRQDAASRLQGME
ncbi:MAG: glycoside hydrolase family 2 TIM barrel-domain containing protein [Armatimonadota bacterium]|nr:hypothetical protein [bacterium]